MLTKPTTMAVGLGCSLLILGVVLFWLPPSSENRDVRDFLEEHKVIGGSDAIGPTFGGRFRTDVIIREPIEMISSPPSIYGVASLPRYIALTRYEFVGAHSSKSNIRRYTGDKVYYQPTREDKSIYRIWYIEVYNRSGFRFGWETRNEEEIGPVYAIFTSTPPLPIHFEFVELNRFQLFRILMKKGFLILLGFASTTSIIFLIMLLRRLRTRKVTVPPSLVIF